MKNKRIKNSIISWIMTLVMIAGELQLPQLSLTAAAYDIEEAGTCGESATYSVSGSTLTISGSGAIANSAFYDKDLSGIESIVIGKDITEIGKEAFRGVSNEQSSAVSFSFENGSQLTKIGDSAFRDCDILKEISIPETVTYIGGYAFSGCTRLETVNIPEGITSIEEYTFNNCSVLKSIELPENVTSIGEAAFRYCTQLESVNIPEGITSIEDCTFQFCSQLKSIEIPAGITTIGWAAFFKCCSLTEVSIPESVTTIGMDAFCECTGVEDVYCYADIKNISWDLRTDYGNEFGEGSGGINAVIHVRKGTDMDYLTKTKYSAWVQDGGSFKDDIGAVSYTVTFSVENGSWDDGTTEDKTVTFDGSIDDTFYLSADDIPSAGSKPDAGYKAGKWDTEPDTAIVIDEDKFYSYRYALDLRSVSYLEGSWENGECVLREKSADSPVLLDSSTTHLIDGNIYVADGDEWIYSRITVSGNVGLILADGCNYHALGGIALEEGNTLSIFGQKDGSGSLYANGDDIYDGYYAPGIGGSVRREGDKLRYIKPGTLNIHGGKIIAIGKVRSAGIGGAGTNESLSDGAGLSGGTVNIYGGNIQATGVSGAAGIGGGHSLSGESGNGGIVNIYGGKVNADGGNKYGFYGAGIGGAYESRSGGSVTILGGKVTANGSNQESSGIGSFYHEGEHGTLTLGEDVMLLGSEDNDSWQEIESPYTTRYRYMTAEGPEPVMFKQVSYTVTFKVVNGSWDDGTTKDKTVSFNGTAADTFYLSTNDIPAVGNQPDKGYKAGKWVTEPDTAEVINEDKTFTYRYALDLTSVSYLEGSWENGECVLREKSADSPVLLDSSTTQLTDGNTYVADGKLTINSRITVSGNVKLILADGCTLSVYEGIAVEEGNTLSIFGQKKGNGNLNSYGDYVDGCYTPGIGGSARYEGSEYHYTKPGTLNIHGGWIYAAGGSKAAGIGGAGSMDYDTEYDDVSGLSGGTVNIYGGYIEAYGNGSAAGIGGGCSEGIGGNGGTVNIYGGEVYAYGGTMYGGAGIGGAHYSQSGGSITILGGRVIAKGGSNRYGDNVSSGIGADTLDGEHGTLTLGEGVSLKGSEDKISWQEMQSPYTTRYRYMTAEGPEPVMSEPVSYTVTFKVVNGSWNDGTTKDKTVSFNGTTLDTFCLSAADIPEVGTKPEDGYKAGRWNQTPDTDTAITEDVTYTYTYIIAPYTTEFEWLGANGSTRVDTGFGNRTGTEGCWYVDIDENPKDDFGSGKSKVIWDSAEAGGNVSVINGNISEYGCLSGTAVLDKGDLTRNPYVYICFDIVGRDTNNELIAGDASAWGGLSISYECDCDAYLVLGLTDGLEATIGYANPQFKLAKTSAGTVEHIPLTEIKQPSWYIGAKMSGEEAAEKLTRVIFKIQAPAGEYHFRIYGIGSLDADFEYTISYELNGGTNAESNPATFKIDTESFALAAPVRDGYEFAGWYEDEGFNTPAAATIEKGTHANKKFYARWKKLLTNSDITVEAIPEQPYTGSAIEPAVVVKDGEKDITDQCTITFSDNTETGTATVSITAKADSAGYAGLTTTTFKIGKPAATVTTAPTANTLTYSGSEQALVTAGVANGGTMVYSLSANGAYSETIPSKKDAGTYTVYYKVSADGSHIDSASASVDVTIARKAVTVTADNKSKTYGAADPAFTATVNGTVGSDTVNYTISRAAGEAAGTYAIIVTGAANQGNYSVSFVNGTFTIIRVKAAVTAAPEAKSLSFNGSAQELVKAGTVSGGNMVYATGSSSAPSTAWSKEIPTGVNAGVYYVWYKALGDAGYGDSDMNCVSVLIAKAAQAAPAAPDLKSASINSITLVLHEGYEYKCSEGSWQSSASFNGLEADTEYTFYQRISGDENHEASPASEGAKFKTDSPAPTPTEEDKPTPTVSDNEPTPTVSDNTPTPTVSDNTPTPTVTPTVTPTPGPLPTFGPTPTPIPVPEEPAEMSFVFANGTDTFSTEYTGSAIKPEILGYCGSRLLAEGKDYTVSYSRNVNAGKATVSVRGKNDYSGTYKLSFTIDPKQIAGENGTAAKGIVVSGLTVQGDKAVKPVIYYNGAEVKKGINTKVSKAADGTETVDLVANGQNFTGELKGLPVYRINDKEEFEKTAIKVELGKVNRVYDGTPQLLGENDLKVTDQAGNKLTEGEDYAVNYSADVINAGTVKVQVTGIGNYTGSKAISYKIAPATDAAISVQLIPEEGMPEGSYSYSKNKVTPAVFVAAKVNDHTNVLSEGIDYTLKYSNNAKAGATGKIKISFTGNYKGTTAQEISFTIEKVSLETAEIFAGDILYKKAGNYKTKPVVTVNGKVVASSEYTVSYSISGNEMPKKLKLADDENEKIITVTVKSKGRSFTDGTKELSTTYRVYRDTKTGISKAKISLVVKDGTKALKNVAYTGSPVTFDPSNKNRQGDIKVKIGKTVLTGAQVFENFDVTYADNVEKGKATIILTAKESSPYSGMCSGSFKIVKRKVK